MARLDSSRPASLASAASRGRRQAALHEVLRAAIVDGRLRPASRLPSTRDLAREHGVARGTVVAVFEQLAAEGYLSSRRGSGTFVNQVLPDELLARRPATPPVATRRRSPRLAERAALLTVEPQAVAGARAIGHPFVAHLPALDAFPIDLWTRLVGACARRATRADLASSSSLGHPRL